MPLDVLNVNDNMTEILVNHGSAHRRTRMSRPPKLLAVVSAVLLSATAAAATAATAGGASLDPDYTVTVAPQADGAAIDKSMYGVFLEDINYAADGGLYAELVRNRSFEFSTVDNK